MGQDLFSLGICKYFTIYHMGKMILQNVLMIGREMSAKILAETWKYVHKRKRFVISVHYRIF